MNRQTLTKIHMLLASFMFPVALMFLVTGGFYTWGIKGSYVPENHRVELDAPLSEDLDTLVRLAERELDRLGVARPSGSPGIKRTGTSFQLEWTGSRRDVILRPTGNPRMAQLQVKETTWYRHFVQLHKAKGGVLFKVYAAALAISLFVILASGFLLAWQVPRFRSLANGAFAAGLVLFVAVAWIG